MSNSDEDLAASLKRDGYLLEPGPSPRSDAEKMADESAAIRLLSGYDVDLGRNVDSPSHFSADENEMRAALARTIRDQMKGISAELLALAIDPFTPSPWPTMRPTAKVYFMRQGRPSSLILERQVVDYIRQLRARSEKPQGQKFYIQSAIAEFKKRGVTLGKSRVHAIWTAYERMIEEDNSKK
ncbi:hypothetical protein CVM73_03535 [Bradyrhizobium forestalis]|uniref:Uncharacterized protein n=1 Tax=Bradyrhizobium forestalis TaxID=1419263 RepID=A0A2M8RFN1_9BRAD|nr:hypothetical protein [Bradyrhizobium forestalis]PJG56633.1 hypothetical protein CVM73_03535 [Bradyrhizobium forestalis]